MDHPPPNSQNPYASPTIPRESAGPSLPPSSNTPNMPLVQPIRISGALSFADYLYGLRLFMRRRARFLLLFGIPAIFLFDALIFSADISKGDFTEFFVAFFLTIAGIFAVITILRFLIHWRLKKACTVGKGPFAQTETVFTEEGYTSEQELMAGKANWAAFRKYRFSDRLIVLFQDGSPNTIVILPRSKFQTQHDWECFIGLLDRKLTRC